MRGLVYRRRVISLLRRNRDYRFLTLALVVSLCGDWFATVALAGLILDKTNSDFLASMVFVAASLPAFFMTPFAGPLADRLDRKRIMVVCSAVQAVAACGLLFARDYWVLGIVAQAVVAAVAAFFSPAAQAATANLVAPEDLPTAIAASGSIWGAMLVVGSGLGALVANGWGRQTAFALDALTFVVAAALLTFVRGKTSVDDRSKRAVRDPMRPIDDTREALRYARGNPLVSGFLLAKFGFGLGTGVVGLLAVLAKRRFGNGDRGTGLLLAARGTGVFVGPFIVRVAARKGMGSVVRACGIGSLVLRPRLPRGVRGALDRVGHGPGAPGSSGRRRAVGRHVLRSPAQCPRRAQRADYGGGLCPRHTVDEPVARRGRNRVGNVRTRARARRSRRCPDRLGHVLSVAYAPIATGSRRWRRCAVGVVT